MGCLQLTIHDWRVAIHLLRSSIYDARLIDYPVLCGKYGLSIYESWPTLYTLWCSIAVATAVTIAYYRRFLPSDGDPHVRITVTILDARSTIYDARLTECPLLFGVFFLPCAYEMRPMIYSVPFTFNCRLFTMAMVTTVTITINCSPVANP